MVDIMERALRVELDEAAQAIDACLHAHKEPYTYDEVCGTKKWREAMNEEIFMIEKNKT